MPSRHWGVTSPSKPILRYHSASVASSSNERNVPLIALLVGIIAVLLIATVLWEAFETIILPRRVSRSVRFTRYFYRFTWHGWARFGGRGNRRRETFLSTYGPVSLIGLLGIWASGLIVGFALLQWACGGHLTDPEGHHGFGTLVYMSGTTFFTLGLGDVTPHSKLARVLTVLEAGTGFGFLGLVITYLPIFYQTFSRREAQINLFDARAGSPPCASELIRRVGMHGGIGQLESLLVDWEQWAAELLEGCLSYPALTYFRSQHENQSWLAALTTILDTCALLLTSADDAPLWRARLTFGMARHAAVDIAQYLNAPPIKAKPGRLPPADLARLRESLAADGVYLRADEAADRKFAAMRYMYEPFVTGLAHRLLFTLPPWLPDPDAKDNWQTTAWDNVL